MAEEERMKHLWATHASKRREVDSNRETASTVGRVERAKPRWPGTARGGNGTSVRGGCGLSSPRRARGSSPGAEEGQAAERPCRPEAAHGHTGNAGEDEGRGRGPSPTGR